MVDALREARRVLKPEGLLADLRPGSVHRRVGFREAGGYRLRWTMRENFDDDRAADRAVAQVLSEGLFKSVGRTRFDCTRVMDTLAEFRLWLDDFVTKGNFVSHDWLVKRVERELASTGKKKIVVLGPLVMRTLKKC